MKLSQLRKIVREELEKYDGGFTDMEKMLKDKKWNAKYNEAVKEIQLKEKIFEPAKWWKSDPEELLRHVYWLKGQMAPSDKKKRAQAYKDIATQLNKKYRAPKKDFQRHFSYDESVSEGFGGELKGKDKEKFEKARKENAEQLGYKLTGKGDIREAIKFSKEEMTQLHQNGKLEKDGYTYVYKEK